MNKKETRDTTDRVNKLKSYSLKETDNINKTLENEENEKEGTII